MLFGHYETRHEIIVYREPEVGIVWEAEAKGTNLCAMGDTPGDAARNLIRALSERGPGQGTYDSRIAEEWTAEWSDDPRFPRPGREGPS